METKNVICAAIIVVVFFIVAFHFLTLENNAVDEDVAGPQDAVAIVCANETSAGGFVANHFTHNENSSEVRDYVKTEDHGDYETIFYKRVSSEGSESSSIFIAFNTDDLKVNGSNNYSTPFESVIEGVYKNAKSVPSMDDLNSSDIITPSQLINSSNVDQMYLKFYDEDGKLIKSIDLPNGALALFNYSHKDAYSIRFQSDWVDDNTYDSIDKNGYVELHMIVKSDETNSSENYYCYDYVFPLEFKYNPNGNVKYV